VVEFSPEPLVEVGVVGVAATGHGDVARVRVVVTPLSAIRSDVGTTQLFAVGGNPHKIVIRPHPRMRGGDEQRSSPRLRRRSFRASKMVL
jgi:hypothetical protein